MLPADLKLYNDMLKLISPGGKYAYLFSGA
jgi:hypothetical protein